VNNGLLPVQARQNQEEPVLNHCLTNTIDYTYDGLSRVTEAVYNNTISFTYDYDGAGNLLSFSRWSGIDVETVSFVYNGANQIACLDGNGNGLCGDPEDIPYNYDRYGNLTSDGLKTYSYDAANRLTSVTVGGIVTTYTYSGDGDRVSQKVDGVTTTYVIDVATPLTMVLAETTGTVTIYYLHGLNLIGQSDGVSTEYFTYRCNGKARADIRQMDSAKLCYIAELLPAGRGPSQGRRSRSVGMRCDPAPNVIGRRAPLTGWPEGRQ
jgi:YD repeat-containing protein